MQVFYDHGDRVVPHQEADGNIYKAEIIWGSDNFKASITNTNQTRSRSNSLTLSRIRTFASDIFDIYLNNVDCAIPISRSIAQDKGYGE